MSNWPGTHTTSFHGFGPCAKCGATQEEVEDNVRSAICGIPSGFTKSQWEAVQKFIARHTRPDGSVDVDAMNAEARTNWLALHPEEAT